MKRTIYNNSSCRQEDLHKKQCPRCRGFGGNFGDEDGCHICNGWGTAWVGDSGITLALHARAESQQYY